MSLEIKRKKLELSRVQMAKSELEFRIEERLEEVEKYKESIIQQKQKESDLIEEIKSLESKG